MNALTLSTLGVRTIDMAKKIQSHATSNVSNLSQIAAYSALKNGLDATNVMKESFNVRKNILKKKVNA